MKLFQELIVGIVIFALGLLMLIKPEVVWKIEHFLSVHNGEPTDWYIAIVRIIGLGFIFIAVFVIVMFILLD